MLQTMVLKHHSMDTCRAVQCFDGRAAQHKSRPGRRQRFRCVSAFLSRAAESISDPILRRALKEPVAFWGGFTAGALALNLKEDPLRSWLERAAADAQADSARQEVVSMPEAFQQRDTQEHMQKTYRTTPSNGSGQR